MNVEKKIYVTADYRLGKTVLDQYRLQIYVILKVCFLFILVHLYIQ